MGTLPIKIETGRYRSISEDQRICDNCNLNEIENEKHFVYHCTKCQNIREIYLDHLIDDDNNDVDNLKMIFSDFGNIYIRYFYCNFCKYVDGT